MTYRIGGQVVDQGSGVSGQPVFVVDTGDANPSNWTVEAATTTNADGSWSVVVGSGDLERYHAVTQFEDAGTLKNAESKPFVTGQPVVRPVEIPIQFEIPSPAISADSAIPDSTIHQWKFDEGSGTTVADSIGNNDGTINGSTWISNASRVGNYWLSHDGIDDYEEMGSVSELNLSNDWSVCITVALENTTQTQVSVWSNYEGSDSITFNVNNNGVFDISIYDGSSYVVAEEIADFSLMDTEVARWGVGLDSSTNSAVIYQNGSEVSTQSGTQRFAGTTSAFVVGGRTEGNQANVAANIDNPIVYNSLLSASEFQDDYNNQPWS